MLPPLIGGHEETFVAGLETKKIIRAYKRSNKTGSQLPDMELRGESITTVVDVLQERISKFTHFHLVKLLLQKNDACKPTITALASHNATFYVSRENNISYNPKINRPFAVQLFYCEA